MGESSLFDRSQISTVPSNTQVEIEKAAQQELESLRLLFSAQPESFIAFDEDGTLIAGKLDHAQARINALQQLVSRFEMLVALLPSLSDDENYQRTQEKMVRQLIHQGNSLASYETLEMITTIKREAYANRLNRGLSLSLPYFDDWALKMKVYDFEVIPRGRILFEEYYVTWAARYEAEKVQQDNRLSPNARRQLLSELKTLERAFEVPGVPPYRQPARKKKSFQARISALRLSLSTITTIAMKRDK